MPILGFSGICRLVTISLIVVQKQNSLRAVLLPIASMQFGADLSGAVQASQRGNDAEYDRTYAANGPPELVTNLS
jgi:hypothetical protein